LTYKANFDETINVKSLSKKTSEGEINIFTINNQSNFNKMNSYKNELIELDDSGSNSDDSDEFTLVNKKGVSEKRLSESKEPNLQSNNSELNINFVSKTNKNEDLKSLLEDGQSK
jgi:hypothetical protein